MAWTASKVFVALFHDWAENTTEVDLLADTCKAALFTDAITPNAEVSSANSAYGAGVWAANEVTDATGWPAGGVAITTPLSTVTTNVYTFDGDDTPSADAHTTLADVYGCLVYDGTIAAPVADQGVCFNYFGGVNSVTAGTFAQR